MNTNLEICITNGLDGVLKKNQYGEMVYSDLRADTEVEFFDLFQQIFNASTIKMTRIGIECLELLREGKVYFSTVSRSIWDESDYYRVPYGTKMSYINIITGYEYKEYSRMIGASKISDMGILNNYRGFEKKVYFFLSLVMILLLLPVIFYTLIQKEKRWIYRRSISIWTMMKVFYQYLFYSFSIKTSARRFTYLAIISFFLIITPFLLMFKTNQIIVPPPKLVKTLRQAISDKITIYHTDTIVNLSMFYEEENFQKVHNYYETNKKLFELPGATDILTYDGFVMNIINQKGILLTQSHEAMAMYKMICSWANNNHLLKIFMFKEESTREYIHGMTFHINYTNPRGLRNYLSAYETGLLYTIDRNHYYIGFDVLTIPLSHKQKQLVLCYNFNQIEMDESSKVYSGDMKTFSPFFRFYFYIILVTITIFVCELLTFKLFPSYFVKRITFNTRTIRITT